MKRVAVFVLGYRAMPSLEAGSLESIERASLAIEGYEVLRVYLDNYSRDGSVQWVARRHVDFDLLLSPVNTLYVRGTNIGIQYCRRKFRPDYYLLVDADNFAEPDAYAALLRFAEENPDVGLVQPLVKSRTDPSSLYSCGHSFTEDGQCRPLKRIPADPSALLDLPSCSISSTLIRSSVFVDCGLLDPIYEIYFESSDLCFRARRAGYRCACHAEAITYNEGTTGSGVDQFHQRYYFNRNRLIFWRIHDLARYRYVRSLQLEVYRGLQEAYDLADFGLDAEREAIRQGIEDGLRIAESDSFLPRQPVSLDGFEKSSAVVLHREDLIGSAALPQS